jgi:hypothetical protein
MDALTRRFGRSEVHIRLEVARFRNKALAAGAVSEDWDERCVEHLERLWGERLPPPPLRSAR